MLPNEKVRLVYHVAFEELGRSRVAVGSQAVVFLAAIRILNLVVVKFALAMPVTLK